MKQLNSMYQVLPTISGEIRAIAVHVQGGRPERRPERPERATLRGGAHKRTPHVSSTSRSRSLLSDEDLLF